MLTPFYQMCNLRLLSFLLSILFISATAFQEYTDPKKKNRRNKYEMLQAWQDQEFQKMVDPKIGRIPYERIAKVENLITKNKRSKLAGNGFQLKWTERGADNFGGRTRTMLIDKNDPTGKKVWVGAVGGGIWFTNDITATNPQWQRPIDGNSGAANDFFTNLAVTAIAQDPSNPQIMYFGTGEGYYNADAIAGRGLYKSLDGGQTWYRYLNTDPNDPANEVVGKSRMRSIQKIAVTPTGTVLVAISSNFCNTGGLMRSTDGGSTWTRISNFQGGDNQGSCTNIFGYGNDIEVASDGTIYASNGIFFVDGIYRSTDDGLTFEKIFYAALFEARTEIAVAPSDPNRVYLMTHDSGNNRLRKLLRCNNAKSASPTFVEVARPNWSDACGTASTIDFTRGQAWYDQALAVDPNNADIVTVGGIDLFRSTNGGTAWTQISEWTNCSALPDIHADQHGIVYTSSSTGFIINDGGIYTVSNFNTNTPVFTSKNKGYNVTQYYAADINPSVSSNNMLAGSQDNGTHKFNVANMNSAVEVYGGDGAFCHIDQSNGNIQVASYVFNNYATTMDNWATQYDVLNVNDRGKFINPTDYDDVNDILYTSDDFGFYGVVVGVGTPAAIHTTREVPAWGREVSAIKVDPNNPNVVWFGLDLGFIYKVTNPSSPVPTVEDFSGSLPGAYLSSLDVQKGNSNHLLATFSNFGINSVWESTNGGTTWTSVEGNLPDMPVYWGIFNPQNPDQALLATEVGVWSTTNLNSTTTQWVNDDNFVNTRIDMLKYRASDFTVVAATHGRGLFTAQFPPQSPVTTIERQAQNVTGYLAPFGDVYYYSATDGQLIARIENLTAFDYGTVTMAVSRASDASATPVDFYSAVDPATKLARKTYQFTPQNANANGTFKVTLFYEAAEITAWETATARSWAGIQMVKCSGNINLVTPANQTAGGTVLIQNNTTADKSAGLPYVTALFTNTGFSSFGVGNPQSMVLPVEIVDLIGKNDNGKNMLSWAVENENNLANYEIERATDSRNFQKIGTLKATKATKYTFLENNATLPMISYYRLKMIEQGSGVSRFSNIIAIQKGNKSNTLPDFRISPNPIGESGRVVFNSPFSKKVDLQLFITDMATGRVVAQQNISNFDDDSYSFQLAPMLARGTYSLTLKNKQNGETKTQRFVKTF